MTEQEESQDPTVLARAATRQVRILQTAVSRYRRFTIMLAIVCVLITGGGIVLGATVVQVNDQAQQSCQAGNVLRMGDSTIWNEFISLLLASDKQAISSSAFQSFEKQIAALPSSDPDKAAFQSWILIQTTSNASSAYTNEANQFRDFISSVDNQRNCTVSWLSAP